MSEEKRKKLLDRIEQLIEKNDFEELRQVLDESHSSDVAEVMEVLDELARQILFDLLDPREAGAVLEKIDEATRSELVEDLSSEELTDIVATLPPDEAADVIAEMSDEQTEKILEQMPKEESAQIEKLLRYPDDSAGGIMTTELVKVNLNDTIRVAIERFQQADPNEDFYHVFVVDDQGRLQGSVDLVRLLRFPQDTPIQKLLERDIHSVEVHTDQEEIANIFRKNDLIVMPVVDQNGVLLGRITVDDVVDVIGEEAEEDALVMAGTHPDELDTHRIFTAARIRITWLMTCLIGYSVYLLIYNIYRNYFTLTEWTSILMFAPIIAAMGGNSGLQTSTIVVRGLATGDLAALNLFQVFFREARIALIIAMTFGIFTGGIATMVLHVTNSNSSNYVANALADLPGESVPEKPVNPVLLGFAVGIAMFIGIMLATTLGLVLPFLFRKIGIDPAISSGPFITTANDSLGCITYFSLALLMLHFFGHRFY
ncbi:MAG: Magnesium transporter MgtE [Planctomycetes bacterium ADurb.Bin412]|nr:MAG: Magnesium transporter MgtE [Planctomycetes bacterium ADurb.Bin412]